MPGVASLLWWNCFWVPELILSVCFLTWASFPSHPIGLERVAEGQAPNKLPWVKQLLFYPEHSGFQTPEMYWEMTGSMCGWVGGVNGSVETPTSSSTSNSRPRAASQCPVWDFSLPQLFCNYMGNTLIPLKRVPSFGRAVWRENVWLSPFAVHLKL